MTRKRFKKLLRAHFTAYYLQHKQLLGDWIGEAYRAADMTKARNYASVLELIQKTLPLKS